MMEETAQGERGWGWGVVKLTTNTIFRLTLLYNSVANMNCIRIVAFLSREAVIASGELGKSVCCRGFEKGLEGESA